MRLARSIWIALAAAVLVAAPAADAARKARVAPRANAPSPPVAPLGPCERDCLGGLVDKVLNAMMDHDPSHAPLAADAHYTENGENLQPGQGLWSTASAIAVSDDGLSNLGVASSAYRLYFADPSTGEAAYFGAFTEKGVPGLMMLRLKAVARQITEIETVVVRKDGAPRFDAKGYGEPEPTLLAGGERWAPVIMTAAANRYFDALQTGSTAGVPLGADCIRRDNGVVTTTAAAGCAAQIETRAFGQILRVRRRVLVVDEDGGLVLAAAMVDHGAPAPEPKKKPKLKKGEVPAVQPAQSTDLMGVVFKMSEGRITRIEAIERPVANDAPLGWN
jgi:hypothetical protein